MGLGPRAREARACSTAMKQYQSTALKHTQQLRGMAITLRMRTTISPGGEGWLLPRMGYIGMPAPMLRPVSIRSHRPQPLSPLVKVTQGRTVFCFISHLDDNSSWKSS